MNKTRWIIFLTATLGLFLLLLASTKPIIQIDQSKLNPTTIQTAKEENGQIGDQIFGKKDAPVVLVVYSDFQCSACASFAPFIHEIALKYSDKVALVLRHLTFVGPHSEALATTAEAAGLQDKFWEMHDLIFKNQQKISLATAEQRIKLMEKYASSLKLDLEKFKKDLKDENQKISQKIKYDKALATKQNVTATPTLFINGKLIDREKISSADDYLALIESAINQAE